MNYDYAVLMSVYHKENALYFRESLESMLAQTVPAKEFVIVCDGPLGDCLDKVIEDFKIKASSITKVKIVRLPECKGLGNALNEGIKECESDIIVRMDSDDISKSDRVKKQLDAMKSYKADMVGAAVEEFEGTTDNIIAVRRLPHTHEEILKFSRQRNPFNHPTMVLNKSAVIRAGGYIECRWFEDYYLWVRMLMAGCIGVNIDEPLLYMRAGEGMYARRGGLKYAVTALRFRFSLYRKGYSSLWDFMKSGGAQLVVSIIPNRFRIMIYRKLLRKSK